MILSIDQGTTGSTCFVYDERAEPRARAYREFRQHFPKPGWVEHDLSEIWTVTRAVALEALAEAGVRAGELVAVGITNQRETVCVWDPSSGEPLHPAIVWQDRRTAALCEQLRAAGHEPLVRARTGLVLDPYFSATKIRWLLENVPGLAARARDGSAVFGTIDSWLLFKLTGEHLTDASNASRTLLYDISSGCWDPELLELFDVPARALPEVRPSAGRFAETLAGALDGQRVPVAGVAGDQQAALFGQACLRPGLGKNTYGTGSFVLLNTGQSPPTPPPGLLATVAWSIGSAADQSFSYALEASIFATGAAVQWLRDGLQIIGSASETRVAGCVVELQRRRLLRAGPRGSRVPPLGPARARHDRRAHARLDARASGAGDARGDRLPGARRGPRDGSRRVADARRAARRRRRDRQRLAHAVPGRHPRRAGRDSADRRDDRARAPPSSPGSAPACGRFQTSRTAWRERRRYEPRMAASVRAELLAGWDDALARARSR